MIPALGAGGPGFKSRIGPFMHTFYALQTLRPMETVKLKYLCVSPTPYTIHHTPYIDVCIFVPMLDLY